MEPGRHLEFHVYSIWRLYVYKCICQPMGTKSPTKKFWPLGIPELQLAVDPLGGSLKKKFV